MEITLDNKITKHIDVEYKRAYNYFKSKTGIRNLTINENRILKICSNRFDKIFTNGKPNLYAIYLKKNSKWELKYVGETKTKYARERLRNHLMSKNDSTGSKLEKVQKHLYDGFEIGVKVIHLSDEKFRHYFEERLIDALSPLEWNIHGVKKKKATNN